MIVLALRLFSLVDSANPHEPGVEGRKLPSQLMRVNGSECAISADDMVILDRFRDPLDAYGVIFVLRVGRWLGHSATDKKLLVFNV